MAADSTVTRKLVVDGKQVENTFRDLNSAANKLKREIKGIEEGTDDYIKKTKELQGVNNNLNKIRKDMRGLGQEQQKTGNSFQKLTKGIKLGGATIVGVVVAISAAFVNVVKDAFAATTAVNKLRKSLNQLTGETGEDLDKLTAKTKSLSDAFGKDLNEVTAAANNLSKQMGISFEESLDLIEKGFIKGADSQDDFLNKIKEYPVQFKNSGLSAEEFIQIATQEARGGVFDDKLLDTVKELGIRLRQLTPTAQAALDLLGEGFSKELQQDINSGTTSTIEAFDRIIERSKEVGLTTSQTQTLIADLGAGALEDLGGLEEATKQLNAAQELNLDTLTESEQAQKTQIELIEERARAENELAKETKEGATVFQNLQIQFQTFVTKGIVQVVKGVKRVIQFFRDLYENSAIVRGAIEVLSFAFRNTFKIIVGIVKTAVGVIKQTFGVLSDIISLDFQSLGNRIQKAFSLSTDTIISQAEKLKREVKQKLENIDLSQVPPQFRKAFERAAEEAKKGLSGIGAEGLASGFLNSALKGLSAVVKEIPDSVNTIIEQVNQGVVSVEQGINSITKALSEQGFTDNQITKFIEELGPRFEEAKQKQKQFFAAQEQAQKAQLEKLKAAREKARQEDIASQKAIQDLRIEVMEEGFEKETARLKLQREREIEEVKGSEEQKRQQILLINQRFHKQQDEIDAKRKEEQKQKEEEEFQGELEKIDLQEEERQLKLEEKFVNGLETEKTRQDAFLDLEQEFLNQRLTLLQEAGKGETSEAFKISKQLLDIQKKRQEQEVANEELTRKAKEQIRELDFQTAKGFVGLFTSLAGESAAAQKFALIAEAFEAIASIKINTAKSIVAFRASPLGILVPGAAEAFAAKAKIQSGIAIGQVLAAKATQFFAKDGGVFSSGRFAKKLARGGFVAKGPSHSQGGISLINNQTGATVGEMEGKEPIMILSKNTYRNNGEVIDRLLHASTNQNGAKIFQQGGIIGETPSSSRAQDTETGSETEAVEQTAGIQLELITKIDELIITIEQNSQMFRQVQAIVDTVQLVDELEDVGTVANEANF